MRTIRITDEVWQSIAAKGRFGETEDDVLRRVFKLPATRVRATVSGRRGRGNKRFAQKTMRARVTDGQLVVDFEGGARQHWSLPAIDDKKGIRRVMEASVDWALEQGATDPGQTNAVRKALTDAGYYLRR